VDVDLALLHGAVQTLALVVAQTPAPETASKAAFDYITPIAGTGLVGIFFLMIVLRIKIMPTYVYEDAKAEWERERAALGKDIDELKSTLREANNVYTTQVIPTLTRVLDAERELVDLRREEQAERRRRGE
jgi:hypothetical protein